MTFPAFAPTFEKRLARAMFEDCPPLRKSHSSFEILGGISLHENEVLDPDEVEEDGHCRNKVQPEKEGEVIIWFDYNACRDLQAKEEDAEDRDDSEYEIVGFVHEGCAHVISEETINCQQ